MAVYVVKDWNRIYENSRSRQVETLLWVAQPNKHDSFGFKSLVNLPDGMALYGAWCIIVQIASKCSPRGCLVKSGVPLDAQAISMLSGASAAAVEECIRVVSQPDIGWLVLQNEPQIHPPDTRLTPECHPPDTQVSPTRHPRAAPRARALPFRSLVLTTKTNTTEKSTRNGNGRWKHDEAFMRFTVDYLATGGAFVDEDFREAFEFCWKTLDFEQRLARMAALKNHAEEYHSDPRFVPKPLKFLRTEWERPIRPLPKARPTKESATSQAKRIMQERATRESRNAK